MIGIGCDESVWDRLMGDEQKVQFGIDGNLDAYILVPLESVIKVVSSGYLPTQGGDELCPVAIMVMSKLYWPYHELNGHFPWLRTICFKVR